jgi:16S rRNA (guanine966-N2)-methyltransferase
MRIVGGKYGGLRLKSPPGDVTRPTAERVREAIASALEARDAIEGRRVLDLYAGTGALGFEVLSRGAAHVTFVEKDARVSQALSASAAALKATADVTVLRDDVTKERAQTAILAHGPFSLVLADPPYREVDRAVQALASLCARGLLADEAVLLLEHGAKGAPELPAEFVIVNRYRYGDTAVALFTHGGLPR